MQPDDKIDRVSDLALEQFVLGELPEPAQTRISERLRTDAALQARFAALQQSDGELRAAYPADVVLPAIRRRAQATESRPRWAWLGLAVTACLVALLVVPHLFEHQDTVGNRLKGDGTTFVVERLAQGGGVTTLLSGDHAHAGDTLQMALHAPVPAFIAVVSIDGRGEASQLLPGAGQALATAAFSGPYLPVNYTLDDAPAFERIFLVGSATVFDSSAALDAARALAAGPDPRYSALPLTSSFTQTSILILKD